MKHLLAYAVAKCVLAGSHTQQRTCVRRLRFLLQFFMQLDFKWRKSRCFVTSLKSLWPASPWCFTFSKYTLHLRLFCIHFSNATIVLQSYVIFCSIAEEFNNKICSQFINVIVLLCFLASIKPQFHISYRCPQPPATTHWQHSPTAMQPTFPTKSHMSLLYQSHKLAVQPHDASHLSSRKHLCLVVAAENPCP